MVSLEAVNKIGLFDLFLLNDVYLVQTISLPDALTVINPVS